MTRSLMPHGRTTSVTLDRNPARRAEVLAVLRSVVDDAVPDADEDFVADLEQRLLAAFDDEASARHGTRRPSTHRSCTTTRSEQVAAVR